LELIRVKHRFFNEFRAGKSDFLPQPYQYQPSGFHGNLSVFNPMAGLEIRL